MTNAANMKEAVEIKKEWERREGETARAYEAFSAYRNKGPARSIAKASEVIGKSATVLKKWCAKHEWSKRAAAYDEYVEAKTKSALDRKLDEVNAAHLDMVRSARESVMVPLRALLKRIENENRERSETLAEIENIPAEKLLGIARPYVKLALDVIKMERLLYGLPTQTIKKEGMIGHSVSHDIRLVNEYIESLPDEELLRIVRNTKRPGTGKNGNGKPLPRKQRG
jgi:hypothetical protein